MKPIVQDVMNRLREPVGEISPTVDSLISGDPSMTVTGIVTTFMATQRVLQQAIEIGANLVITHEGVFYSHSDERNTWGCDSVYMQKNKLINESGIAIFRFHDYLHRYQPDGVMVGLVESLGWKLYVLEHRPTATILALPEVSVLQIVEQIKEELGIPFVRVVGDLDMKCTRVGLLVGYRGGGKLTIPLFERDGLDLIIVGEGPEWETPEYVRDAVFQGRQKALIFLGHAQSEEPGMQYLATLVEGMFPGTPVYFLSEKPCFQVV